MKIRMTVIAIIGMSLGVNAQEKISTENGDKSDFIYKNGKIGIGVSDISTTDKLTVAGNVNIGGNGNSAIKVRHINGKRGDSSDFDNLYLNYSTGKDVWIGSSGKKSSLYIQGNFRGYGSIVGEQITSNGNILGRDIVSGGSNAWKIHTPDENGRTTMYLGPIIDGAFRWEKGVYFHNSGKVEFNNNILVRGGLNVKEINSSSQITGRDIVSGGSNAWKIHTPDENGRTTMYLGPIIDGAFRWEKGVYFHNSGKVSFNNNISVQGKIESTEIKVTTSPTADFVFEEDYNLPSLKSIEKHIKEKKHLPEIASAKEMEKNGVNVGNFQIQLLQKIEELTLYTIEQENKIKSLEKQQKEIEEQKK